MNGAVGELSPSALMNGYSYSNGNPVSITDPSGLCPFCVIALGALILGGVTATSYDVFVNQGFGGENLFRQNLSDADWGRAARVGVVGAGIGVVTAASAAFILSNVAGLATVAGQQGLYSLGFTQAAHAAMWNIGGTLVLDSLAYHGLEQFAYTSSVDVQNLLVHESHNPLLATMFLADFAFGAYEQFQALGGWTALRAQWSSAAQVDPGVSLRRRRAWYTDNPLGFSSEVVDSLHQVFRKYPVQSGDCRPCAREIARVLADAGFDVQILHISDAAGAPRLMLREPMPNGSRFIALRGQGHRVVQINVGDNPWYLDALVYDRVGVNPVTIGKYKSWWDFADYLLFTPHSGE